MCINMKVTNGTTPPEPPPTEPSGTGIIVVGVVALLAYVLLKGK